MALDCPEQVCGFVLVDVSAFVIDDRKQHEHPLCAIACSFTGLAFRVANLEGTALELCPSLHLNGLIRSVCLRDLCTESLTALLIRVREIKPLAHGIHWTLHRVSEYL